MQVSFRRAGAVALLVSGAALVSSACVRNESSIFIRACLSVPRDSCLVQASETAVVVLSGGLDAAYRAQYECVAMFENQLVARGDTTKLRTETSRVQLYSAEVQVLTGDPDAPVAYSRFSVPITGFADPGTSTSPGLGVTNLTLIDAGTAQILADEVRKTGRVQQVVASVIVHGRTLGGLEVESNEFKFPIQVYVGSSCIEPAGEPCYESSQNPTPDCMLGQDTRTDCRLLAGAACEYLECYDNNIATAHCPLNGVADGSCCNLN